MIRKLSLFALLLAVPVGATDVEKKVQFAPGTSGAVLKGEVDVSKKKGRFGPPQDRYHLQAAKDQTMKLSLQSDHPVLLYIWHKDYNQGFLWHNDFKPVKGKTLKLPVSDDYVLDVEPAEHVNKASYTLTVDIR